MSGVLFVSAPLAAAAAVFVVAGWLRSRGAVRGVRPAAHSATTRFVVRARWRDVEQRWSHRRIGRDRFGPSDLAAWVDDLSRSVRRGATLRQTLLDVTPRTRALAEATEPLRHRLERGAGVGEACGSWCSEVGESDRRVDRQLAAVASVLSIASTVGGGSAAPLDRLAAAMRQAAADDLERSAQSAQAIISARVLTFVPVAMLALLLAIDPDVREVARSATGASVVACGLVLNAIGGWWMRRIITGNLR